LRVRADSRDRQHKPSSNRSDRHHGLPPPCLSRF
jgi:hypothetical protein